MPTFVIVHGNIKAPHHLPSPERPDGHPGHDNGHVGPSKVADKPHTIELSEKEAEKMDPGCTKPKLDGQGKEVSPWAGTCLKPLALFDAELKAAAAAKGELDKAKGAELKAAAAAKVGGK